MKFPDKIKCTRMFVGCLVSDKRGRVLCQLRDDKPGVDFPGYWISTPGGRMKAGENPRQAIRRELAEEFEIEVKDLEMLKTSSYTSGKYKGVYHFFLAHLLTLSSKIRCHEGQKAKMISMSRALKLRQHPLSLAVLREFASKLTVQREDNVR